jgi:hypothetical protein
MVYRMEEFLNGWGIAFHTNKATHTLTLRHNGAQIIFGSAESPLSLEGTHLEGGCWIDEAGQMPRIAWDVAERRTGLFRSPILITTVPYFHNWLKADVYDPYIKGERTDVEWINCATKDNILYSEETIEQARRSKRPEYFEIYYLGNFARPYGLVFPDPTIESVIVDVEREFPGGIPAHWPCISGHDFGINDPNAAVWGRLDPVNDILYVVAEYEAPSLTMRTHVSRWTQAGLDLVDYSYGDPSGADQMEQMREMGWKIEKANNDILMGIDIMDDRFRTGRLRIFPGCKTLLDYKQQFTWAKNPKNEDELLDKPADPQPAIHMMDALRYLCTGIFENPVWENKIGPIVIAKRRRIAA